MIKSKTVAHTRLFTRPPVHTSPATIPFSFLEQTIESGGLGFAKFDPLSGKLVSTNPRFCHMLGYATGELCDGSFTSKSLTHPDDIERCNGELQRLFRGEIDSYTIDKRFLRKDGSILPARVTVTALERDGDNCAAEMIGVISAPADTKSTDYPAPRRDQPRSVAFWTKDFRTKSASCSEGLNILLGRSLNGPPPTFEDFVAQLHPEDRPRVLEEARRVSNGMVYTSEHRIVRPSGEIRWVNQTVMPVFDDLDEVVGLVGVSLDVTEAKRGQKYNSATSTVQAVKRYVDQNWDKPLNIAALAAAASVNTRTLFKHCKLAWGFTPNEYIKRVRLNHARALLQMPERSTTVLGTALKCCFQNQGHFARDYRLAFGERPSETLERARQRRGR
ncbi:helix-turn-helix domain-containing protein [Rhodopseudomonas palustris]|uniref:histidine kinase n=1 Tax=Rhodopseudomonas palustris (strain BisB18) TaxID=316056 RepID=Q219X2_RHOPB